MMKKTLYILFVTAFMNSSSWAKDEKKSADIKDEVNKFLNVWNGNKDVKKARALSKAADEKEKILKRIAQEYFLLYVDTTKKIISDNLGDYLIDSLKEKFKEPDTTPEFADELLNFFVEYKLEIRGISLQAQRRGGLVCSRNRHLVEHLKAAPGTVSLYLVHPKSDQTHLVCVGTQPVEAVASKIIAIVYPPKKAK